MDLIHREARWLAAQLAAEQIPFARMIECRRHEGGEIVVFDVDVDAVQHPVHDIRLVEPIAVHFATGDGAREAPEVWALREDFPTDAPHLNQRDYEYPSSLCLYDVPFRDVRAQWTPARFVSLIRKWLGLTARGTLHADDQPLERLLTDGAGWIVLPRSIREESVSASPTAEVRSVPLVFEARPDHHGRPVLVARKGMERPAGNTHYVAAVTRIAPRVHGVIRRAPRTLAELHEMLAVDGDDLLGMLRDGMRHWMGQEHTMRAKCLLILHVPKRRVPDGAVEAVETWVFLTGKTVAELGEALDLWQRSAAGYGGVLFVDPAHDGRDVPLELGYPIYTQSRQGLAWQNGADSADDRRIVAIGGGALGSQVMLNAARAAAGRWTVVDDDMVFPHNLARHVAEGDAVGWEKANCLAVVSNGLADDVAVHDAIVADVLAPGDREEALHAALTDATLIVDMSASVAVARALACDLPGSARRVSLFLNPSGTDLTLLAEDEDRSISLDMLEMQYYRAVARRSDLAGALALSQSRVRYGRSCRDVSVALPQALVAMHAGIGTISISRVAASPGAQTRVWRVDPATLAVAAIDVPVEPVHCCTVGEWQLVVDDAVLRRMAELRAAKLPNETGGVLVGTYDFLRRIVYVVDVVPSPRDSQEYPTSYMRGAENLAQDVERLTDATAGQLHYIGEWHSHPVGHRCAPSGADQRLFEWLQAELAKDGLPALMMIVGDRGLAVPYLGQIVPSTEYPAELYPVGASPG